MVSLRNGGVMKIVPATLADAAQIAAIYAHSVEHGIASFETEPPDIAEMTARMSKVLDAGSPWLVALSGSAQDERVVLGYAYASQFRDRPAYRFGCENSIYIRDDLRGGGIGSALLSALIVAATDCGFRQMIAVIGGAGPASAALHARAGFVRTGQMRSIGRKHGQWLDTLYMQLALGEGDNTSPD
jgi:L-amino acid N-acyltransferase YncA